MVKIRTVTLDDKVYSLGLRNNPNILQYQVGQWYKLPQDQIQAGNSDWGGIWVARTMSGETKLQKYMKEKYDSETRIFRTALEDILFFNNYRIKTNGVYLIEEISD